MIGIGSIGLEYGSWLYYGGRLGIYTMVPRPTGKVTKATVMMADFQWGDDIDEEAEDYEEFFVETIPTEEVHFVNRSRETVEVVAFDPTVHYTYPGILTGEDLAPHLAAIKE